MAAEQGTSRRGSGPARFDAVVEAAARGEPAALSELFRNYQPMLLRYLRNRAFDVADDVAGEVWLAVARNVGRFVGDEAGFRRWLFTIARCRLIEVHRQQGRRRTAPVPPEVFGARGQAHPSAGSDDPALVVVDQLSAQRAVDAIVAGLTPDQAEAILLRVVAGLEVAEVAAVMGHTASSVRVLCHRGLRRLRDRYPERQLVG